MSWLLGVALAAPVQCEALAAAQLLAEARIDEARASKTHPWLVPGLALASPRADPALRSALGELCAEGGDLSISGLASWETASWAAHSLRLTRSETRDCLLFERSITLTVGTEPGAAPRYALQATLPLTQTPVGECSATARWHDERILQGEDGPVRIVLATLHDGEQVTQSEIQIRRATPTGWKEQVLVEPASDRLLGGFEGPRWTLAEVDGSWVAVAGAGRSGDPERCTPTPGQHAWTWSGEEWIRHDSDATRALLAQHGLWRLAGDPGWLLILGQDTADDRELLESRARRLNRKNPDPLLILESADFPELNAGYLVIAPWPFASQADAEAARSAWGRRAASYVKRAWPPPDACADDPR